MEKRRGERKCVKNEACYGKDPWDNKLFKKSLGFYFYTQCTV